MLGKHKIIVDTFAEVYDILRPYADGEFWDFSKEPIDSTAIYLIGRLQLKQNLEKITDMVNHRPGSVIFCNPAEGSQTILFQTHRMRVHELIKDKKLKLLTSGNLEPGFHQLSVDCYFSHIVEYLENIEAAALSNKIYENVKKPYSFLFLNGRLRMHRKRMIDYLRNAGLLENALWTCLQSEIDLPVPEHERKIYSEPLRILPEKYEIERAIPQLAKDFPGTDIKNFLFNNTWGDAIVNPQCYIDTYFSVVTETVYEYPYSFRTEKIWKPILMAHPWIAVANYGYYRDIRNAGFKTFSHLIDETFDLVDNNQDRMERIVAVVNDICYNGAASFLMAAEDTCKYNQQLLKEYNTTQRGQLPGQLLQYIDERP
jgi:hypothetical protein